MNKRRPVNHDLMALLAILTTGVILIAIGLPAESLVGVTVAMSALFGTWRSGRSGNEGQDPRQR